uniref:hypothetical protein n=1 Tax=Sphingomonas bacterium TaxID=1895847 RepID=UPI002624DCCB|nr:hypothetical protein [Sphingomonas bacterium]
MNKLDSTAHRLVAPFIRQALARRLFLIVDDQMSVRAGGRMAHLLAPATPPARPANVTCSPPVMLELAGHTMNNTTA